MGDSDAPPSRFSHSCTLIGLSISLIARNAQGDIIDGLILLSEGPLVEGRKGACTLAAAAALRIPKGRKSPGSGHTFALLLDRNCSNGGRKM